MCGRFTLVRLSDFLDQFPWISPPSVVPADAGDDRYNIAPTQTVAAVLRGRDAPAVQFVKWGLVPSWAKDAAGGGKMINARAETLAERPAFRQLVAGRRCLIPADGFYEWKPGDGGAPKVPYHVRLTTGRPFALAGLYDQWHDPAGPPGAPPLTTCTIITAEPNELVARLHNRMAVIVRPEDYRRWLSGRPLPPDELSAVLAPFPAEQMEAYPVSTAVNRVGSDGPALIRPAPISPAPTRPADAPTAVEPTLF